MYITTQRMIALVCEAFRCTTDLQPGLIFTYEEIRDNMDYSPLFLMACCEPYKGGN